MFARIINTLHNSSLAAKAYICDVIRENQLIEGQKEQALVRRRAFFAAPDQSLYLMSHMIICRKHFSRFLDSSKTICEWLWIYRKSWSRNCGLLLHEPGFYVWCHVNGKCVSICFNVKLAGDINIQNKWCSNTPLRISFFLCILIIQHST